MAELSIAKNQYADYKCDANEVIHFKLVRSEHEVFDNGTSFHPDMCHQLFGESESIFGYKDLRVEVFCTAAKMTTYVGVKHSGKVNEEKEGLVADNISKILSDRLQPGFFTNIDEFVAQLPKDANFKPYGELIHSYTVTKDGFDRHFEIYKTDIEAPGFRGYHERIQPYLLFYVDAASYIDVDDDRWSYYLLFEKYKSNGNPMYAFAGYMTVYNYYAYPEKVRPRISQVLVMPPFQKQGHGATMIQTFYNECYNRPEVLDITVEDPSENFQRVRDFVDVKSCMKLASFQSDKLHSGFCDEMAIEARNKYRINRKQSRRVYEILRLHATNPSDKAQYRSFRLDVKKRLNAPFQKNGRDCKKLERMLMPTELAATMNNLSLEQRLEYLQKAFEECEEEYRRVLERLASSD